MVWIIGFCWFGYDEELELRYQQVSIVVLAGLLAWLSACKPSTKPEESLTLTPIEYAQLPNWDTDHFEEFWPAWLRSCESLLQVKEPGLNYNPRYFASQQILCRQAQNLLDPSREAVRHFLEAGFQAYKATVNEKQAGLFTGYYEPILAGSRQETPLYATPLYRWPEDLVMIENLGDFNPQLKGQRLAGRVLDKKLKPYFSHQEIAEGALAHRATEIMWVNDPIAAFFMQIQGSGAILTDTGETVRLGYAATNGHPYTPIGRRLIERKILKPETVTKQSIEAWLRAHPQEAAELLYQNASYVFFREIVGPGPIGSQGVVLTPGRSLAVDPKFVSFGTPLWLDIQKPNDEKSRLQRLVLAQDTGGAIKGAIRGDVFWGTGDAAGEIAGVMKSTGTYYLLLPR